MKHKSLCWYSNANVVIQNKATNLLSQTVLSADPYLSTHQNIFMYSVDMKYKSNNLQHVQNDYASAGGNFYYINKLRLCSCLSGPYIKFGAINMSVSAQKGKS